MADEIDTRKAIAAAKEAFNTFSQSSKEYWMELLFKDVLEDFDLVKTVGSRRS